MRDSDAIVFLTFYLVLGSVVLVMSNHQVAILFIIVLGIMFPYGSGKILKFLFRPLKRFVKSMRGNKVVKEKGR